MRLGGAVRSRNASTHALVKGIDAHVNEDVAEARVKWAKPLILVIEGALMAGMNVVGRPV